MTTTGQFNAHETHGSGASGDAANGNGNGVYAATGEIPADIVRVLRGEPDDDELAALVAGIVASHAASHEEVDDGSRTSLWTNHGHRLGLPPSAARASWRWSSHASA